MIMKNMKMTLNLDYYLKNYEHNNDVYNKNNDYSK